MTTATVPRLTSMACLTADHDRCVDRNCACSLCKHGGVLAPRETTKNGEAFKASQAGMTVEQRAAYAAERLKKSRARGNAAGGRKAAAADHGTRTRYVRGCHDGPRGGACLRCLAANNEYQQAYNAKKRAKELEAHGLQPE